MCRSSRILCFLLVMIAGPAGAQGIARGAGPGTALSGANPGVRTGVMRGIPPNRGVAPNVVQGVRPGVGNGVAPNRGVLPGVRSGLAPRGLRLGGGYGTRPFGRFRGGRRFGGIDAVGLGLSLAGDLAVPAYYGDPGLGYDGGEADVAPAYAPPPRCAHPLIIAIGHGLRRPARTRVVYGQPAACVP